MSTISLGIPTINRADLLQEALEVYSDTWMGRKVMIIDNGKQEIKLTGSNQKTINSPYNLGVASSWNLICKSMGFKGYTHVAILNDDILWKKFADDIEDYIALHPADLYLGTIENPFCCFVLSIDAFYDLGPFDADFKTAYFEDNDYLYRMKLAGMKIHYSSFFNPDVYRNSQSIAKDPSLNQNFEINKQRYIQKWGGVPTEEKFKKPFTKNDNSL